MSGDTVRRAARRFMKWNLLGAEVVFEGRPIPLADGRFSKRWVSIVRSTNNKRPIAIKQYSGLNAKGFYSLLFSEDEGRALHEMLIAALASSEQTSRRTDIGRIPVRRPRTRGAITVRINGRSSPIAIHCRTIGLLTGSSVVTRGTHAVPLEREGCALLIDQLAEAMSWHRS